MRLLIFGSDEGFYKLQEAYMTNGLFFHSGGISFGRSKGTSGSEADDETQLTFYTEQYRSRRRSKGKGVLGKIPEPAFAGGMPGKQTLCSGTNLGFSSTLFLIQLCSLASETLDRPVMVIVQLLYLLFVLPHSPKDLGKSFFFFSHLYS